MAHSAEAIIDLNKLSFNLKSIRERVGPDVRICAVVKADAYGHGAVEVSRQLEMDGVDMLGVAGVGEAVELRDAGIAHPILIFGALLGEEAERIGKYRLTPIITDIEFAERLDEVSTRPIPVHVKIDTGMGRLGFSASEAVQAVRRISALENIFIEGLLTHFPSSDESDKAFTCRQIDLFKNIIAALGEKGIEIPIIHAANSGAIIDVGQSYFNMVRPGIMLYGLLPSKELTDSIEIKPVMKIVSRIVHIKKASAGAPLSYGRTFVTKRESVIGVVPMGYADGFNRLLSNRAHVKIKDDYAPIAGRVCMDQFLVDITDIPDVRAGCEVVVYSEDSADVNSVENIAFLLNTIPNEVVCAVSKRVRRKYIREKE